jgi:phage antirepressor YoqD-like protein
MERSLEKAAKYFGLTRPKLIALMREKSLLNDRNLPSFPVRDREYLRIKESNWYHETAGMQYSQSTKVRQAGMRWLAEQLGLDLLAIAADHRDVA